ncbi:MAG: GGDEF domain-containing protein, partial [Candidatus Firestonebacteria bacterium]|nr:GGDEF domain-containing protein [Candidatus Firestonebacteria bacterium]
MQGKTSKGNFDKIQFFFIVVLAILPWMMDYIKFNSKYSILFLYFSKLINTIVILFLLNKIWQANNKIEEKNKEIDNLTIIDSTSGLYNLAYFYQQIEKEVDRAERQHYPIFLGIIELDQKKEIAKLMGEKIEDDILIKLTKILTDNIRKNVDTAFRYNEHMFAIILSDLNITEAKVIGERILKNFLMTRDTSSKYKVYVLSLGFMQFHSGWDIKTYNQRVFKVMLEAKKGG